MKKSEITIKKEKVMRSLAKKTDRSMIQTLGRVNECIEIGLAIPISHSETLDMIQTHGLEYTEQELQTRKTRGTNLWG